MAYAAHGFQAVGLFLSQKTEISHKQNVKIFQFYIRMTNFRLPGSIIKKVDFFFFADSLDSCGLLKVSNQRHV